MAKLKFNGTNYSLQSKGITLVLDASEIMSYVGIDTILKCEENENCWIPCYTVFSPYKQPINYN